MRRRQLLDAARRSILRHGLARTTLATVAEEAGLSQGVAVFYFDTKAGLLTEALRDLYQGYEDHWQAALEAAGPAAEARLRAIVAADFDLAACGPDLLPLWFAFWGELPFQPHYDTVAEAFDTRRRAGLTGIWQALLPPSEAGEAGQYADWTETLTDGYWQRLHLSAGHIDRHQARASTQAAITRLAPWLDDPAWRSHAARDQP